MNLRLLTQTQKQDTHVKSESLCCFLKLSTDAAYKTQNRMDQKHKLEVWLKGKASAILARKALGSDHSTPETDTTKRCACHLQLE